MRRNCINDWTKLAITFDESTIVPATSCANNRLASNETNFVNPSNCPLLLVFPSQMFCSVFCATFETTCAIKKSLKLVATRDVPIVPFVLFNPIQSLSIVVNWLVGIQVVILVQWYNYRNSIESQVASFTMSSVDFFDYFFKFNVRFTVIPPFSIVAPESKTAEIYSRKLTNVTCCNTCCNSHFLFIF